MAVGGMIFGLVSFCLFMLGGWTRTVFLYTIFTLFLGVLAFGQGSHGSVEHFATWTGIMSIYAYAIAQDARDGGSVGRIGKWWWMFRYACRMRTRTIDCSWRFCWESAQCSIDNDDYWHEWSPIDACDEELSCWSD